MNKDIEFEAVNVPLRHALLAILLKCERIPTVRSIDVDPRTTIDKLVQMVMSFEVDRVFDEQCLQVSYLVICDVLACVSPSPSHVQQ